MARTFDGSNSNYLVALGLKYDLPTNCSICLRLKTSSAAWMAAIGTRGSGTTGGWAVGRPADSVLRISVWGPDAFHQSNSGSLPADGNYHSCIVTKVGSDYLTYVDDGVTASGSPNALTYTAIAGTPTGLGVGTLMDNTSSNATTDGAIYDVALYSRALSEADRVAYMGGAIPSGADHAWPLDNAAAGNETASAGAVDLTEVGTVGYEATGGGGGSAIGAGLSSSPLLSGRLLRGLVR